MLCTWLHKFNFRYKKIDGKLCKTKPNWSQRRHQWCDSAILNIVLYIHFWYRVVPRASSRAKIPGLNLNIVIISQCYTWPKRYLKKWVLSRAGSKVKVGELPSDLSTKTSATPSSCMTLLHVLDSYLIKVWQQCGRFMTIIRWVTIISFPIPNLDFFWILIDVKPTYQALIYQHPIDHILQ